MTLASVQRAVRQERQRSLRMAAAIDEVHLAEARSQLGKLAAAVEQDGWQVADERRLATTTRDVALSAASQMIVAAGDHAAAELGRIDDGLARIARGARLVVPARSDIERLAEEMADRIDVLLGASAEPHVDLAAQSYQLERIVQTEAWRAYASQRRAIETALAMAGHSHRTATLTDRRAIDIDGTLIIIVVEWDAWLDRRTCPQCSQRDGTLRPLGMSFPGGVESPPLHPRCRCLAGYWPVPIPV